MELCEAVKDLREQRKEDPTLKLFRVMLDGVSDVKVDTYCTSHSEEEAIDAVLESACSMKHNDFDKMAVEIDLAKFGYEE